jgi:hypothetical protein
VKVSGFSICRNAVKLGYPIEESIRSLLPLVDELVVGVGDSDDGTWEVVSGIGDPKIKPFPTVWDLATKSGGVLLSEQTNLALERCSGDWAVYLQSDELLHEDEVGLIRDRLQQHLSQPTEGLSFKYLHFYGSFATVQDNWCRWYRREVRAVKTGRGVISVGDAAGFRIRRDGALRRLIRADAGAHVYHYGWVRPPTVMSEKRQHMERLYGDPAPPTPAEDADPYGNLGHLRRFDGSHPALMAPVVVAQDWTFASGIDRQPPRWRRYLGLAVDCPRDTLRIIVSRLLLAWNSLVPAPKLR